MQPYTYQAPYGHQWTHYYNPVVVSDGGDGERAGAAPDGGRGAGRGGGGGPAGGGGAGSRAAAAVVQLLRPGPAGGGQHPRHHDGTAGEGAGSTRPGLEEIVWQRNLSVRIIAFLSRQTGLTFHRSAVLSDLCIFVIFNCLYYRHFLLY